MLWFMGSGPFGALCLGYLGDAVFQGAQPPSLRVVTGLPSRSGRGMRENVSPVEERAHEMGITAITRTGPLSQNGELLALLEAERPEAILVADFGQMVREPFLSRVCLNIHPSLLPRWRGAAPIQRALMNGDTETGVTVFRLTPGMDAGPILARKTIPLAGDEPASALYPALARLGAGLVKEGLDAIARGEARFTEQDHALATPAPKLDKKEFEVSWSWPSAKIHNTVRALDASGGAFVLFRGRRLKLWRTAPANGAGKPGQILSTDPLTVACGQEARGAVRLEEVQAEGKRRTAGSDWARGLRLKAGDNLS